MGSSFGVARVNGILDVLKSSWGEFYFHHSDWEEEGDSWYNSLINKFVRASEEGKGVNLLGKESSFISEMLRSLRQSG